MAIPTTKDELLQAIRTNYSKLVSELSDIPIDQTNLLTLPGHTRGTSMSINNLISYLIGWGELVLKWNKKSEDHKQVDFPETAFKWNELGKLAQKFYQDYADINFTTLCTKLDQTVLAIEELIVQKSNMQLYGVPWYEKWTLGRMIQLNTASPYQNAVGRIRKWKKEQKMNSILSRPISEKT
ncbi:ClbS/DfsB family four-helix bundle protein [Sphingobacterium multivorum]|uniref:ClbS/DfsB family four-helix bundle protein n=1 Tax=Sphingobacterium multivorum TaxID=28454 RepID=UPI0031B9BD6D